MPRPQVCFELYRRGDKVYRADNDAEFRVAQALPADRDWDCFVLELDVTIVHPSYWGPVGDCSVTVRRAWYELIDRDEEKRKRGDLDWVTITQVPAAQSVTDAVWREYEDEIIDQAVDMAS